MRAKSLALFTALAGLALIATQDSASACCKSKYQANKPHVNVGTDGNPPSSVQRNGQSGAASRKSRNRTFGAKPRKGQQQELMIFVTPHLTTPTN